MNNKMKKILIFGLGRSGQGLLDFLAPQYPEIWVTDDAPFNADELSNKYHTKISDYDDKTAIDLVLLSPGISPEHPLVKKWMQQGVPLQSELDFAAEQLAGAILAISGTNGKSTTTAWCAHIMGVPAAGNIGIPLSSTLRERAFLDWNILEVSSFQLEFSHTLHPKLAAILNITPDHINWHGSLDGYISSKKRLFARMEEGDSLLLGIDSPMVRETMHKETHPFEVRAFSLLEEVDRGAFLRGGGLWLREEEDIFLVNREELSLKGDHNVANALATASLTYCAGVDIETIRRGLTDFSGLPHRYEVLGTIRGRRFINDSKATNAESTLPALKSATSETIVLLGGFDKGTGYDALFEEQHPHLKAIVCYGASAQSVAQSAKKYGIEEIYYAQDLEEAFEQAVSISDEGDDILLSPASASWDVYPSFEVRGDHFRELVRRWNK